MTTKPAFDPATEAFLADLRKRAEGAPPPPPFKLGQSTPAPPLSMTTDEAIKIGEDAKREILTKLDEATNGKEAREESQSRYDDKARGEKSEAAGAEAGSAAEPSEGAPPVELKPSKKRKHEPSKEIGVGLMPHRMAAANSSIARHASPKAEAGAEIMELSDDHPAIVEGRSLFTKAMSDTWGSPRFLVSGKNNPKLGGEFRKGPWTGYPLFHLALEERATCPRSCRQFKNCMGNGMPFARRHDHRDPDFIYALKAEIVTTARAHPEGFVVRLHTLGDFYSIEYVRLWADLLDTLPNIRVFGYTARREDEDDEESRRIAKAIRWLTEQAWDLFAIRFSGHDGPQGSIVVSEPDNRDHVVMCPAQTYATAACVTCGLCSSPEAKDKAIGFLLHGRKLKTQNKASERRDTGISPHVRKQAPAAVSTAAVGAPQSSSQPIHPDGRQDDDGGAQVTSPDLCAVTEPTESDRKETLRRRRIERAERIASDKLADKPASDVIAEARAKISLAGGR